MPLAEFLVAEGDGTLGMPTPARSSEEKARLWYQLARAAEETGDLTRANEAYRVSLAAQPDGDEALAPRRDLAALMFRQERWSEAAAAYEALLATHGPVLKRNDKLTALERLGIAYREAGEPAKAIEPLEKALQLEPRRRVVLETLVERRRRRATTTRWCATPRRCCR